MRGGVMGMEGYRSHMTWIKSNWRWGALNLFAVLILVYVLPRGSTGWNNTDMFDRGLESGKWAIRFLLGSLTMTPLNSYFGWRSALGLGKPAGLWAFGFASVHILFYMREAKLDWLVLPMPFFLVLGLTGTIILSALAITSNRWSMKRLGRNWKRLHRLVYLAGTTVVTHSLLATFMSKKLMFRDPQAVNELKIHAAVLFVLLAVRVPVVREISRQIPVLLKRHRKPGLKIGHTAMPDGGAELWPRVQGRESGVSLKPAFMIPNEMPDLYEQTSVRLPSRRIDGGLDAPEAGLTVESATDEGEIREAIPNY